MADPEPDPTLPIKLEPCSNGEFYPAPMTPVVRETIRRTHEAAAETARRVGMSRRRFLHTLAGSALTLVTLDACSSEERAANGENPPGGTFASSLPPTSTTEPEAAAEVLAGEEFIFDVQGHLLEYDLSEPYEGQPFLGQAFPQQFCGEDDPRVCFSIEQFTDLMFLQSDTSAVVLSALPIIGANPLSIEVMEQTTRVISALCEDVRVLAHGQGQPNIGDPAETLEGLRQLRADHDIAAWKVYTHLPGSVAFFLDDHDASAPQVGHTFLDMVAEVGPPIVCVHKGFRGVGGGGGRFADPVDVGPVAIERPDIGFVVYHSGFESDVSEGPYQPEGTPEGVDRLIRSAQDAGLQPGANVYAELGSTWRALMGDPTAAAHVLGKLLVAFGPDNVVWGTDSIWYGTPQDQIEAFRAFEITPQFQEQYGYPELTQEIKAKILGLNSAALYGIKPTRPECDFSRDELRSAREEVAAPYVTYGPTAESAVTELLAAHGAFT